MSDDLKKIPLRNSLTNYLLFAWQTITSLYIVRVTVLGLGTEYYGYWSLLWSVFGYTLLLDFGLGQSLQKYTAEVIITGDYTRFNKIISNILCSSILTGLFLIIFTSFCAFFLEHLFSVGNLPDLRYCKEVFLIFGIGLSFTFATGFFSEILMGLKRGDIKNYVTGATYTIKVIGICLAFSFGFSLMTLAIISAAVDIMSNLIMIFIVRRMLPDLRIMLRWFDIQTLREIGSFSLYAYLFGIATIILFQADAVILGVMLGMGYVGIYQIGTRISYVLDNLSIQFQKDMPVVAASLYKSGDAEKLRWILLKNSKISVFISTGCFVIFFLLAKQILYLWLDVRDDNALYITYIMLCSAYISAIFRNFSVRFMQMAGKHKEIARIYSVECVIKIALSILLVHLIGVIGVVIGTIVPNFIFSLFIIFRMFARFSSFSIIYYLKKVYCPIIIVVIPTVILLLLANYVKGQSQWGYTDLLIWSVSGGLVFLGMGYLFYFTKEEKDKYLGVIPVINKIYKSLES